MANIRAHLVVLKTDQFIRTEDGPSARVTPEMLQRMADENGWAVEPIPGVVDGLQAMVEINFSTPNILGRPHV